MLLMGANYGIPFVTVNNTVKMYITITQVVNVEFAWTTNSSKSKLKW